MKNTVSKTSGIIWNLGLCKSGHAMAMLPRLYRMCRKKVWQGYKPFCPLVSWSSEKPWPLHQCGGRHVFYVYTIWLYVSIYIYIYMKVAPTHKRRPCCVHPFPSWPLKCLRMILNGFHAEAAAHAQWSTYIYINMYILYHVCARVWHVNEWRSCHSFLNVFFCFFPFLLFLGCLCCEYVVGVTRILDPKEQAAWHAAKARTRWSSPATEAKAVTALSDLGSWASGVERIQDPESIPINFLPFLSI